MYMYYRYLILIGLALIFLPLFFLWDILPAMAAVLLFFTGLVLLTIGTISSAYHYFKGQEVMDERTRKISYKGTAIAFFVTIPILFVLTAVEDRGIIELSVRQFFWIFIILFALTSLFFQTYYKRKGDID